MWSQMKGEGKPVADGRQRVTAVPGGWGWLPTEGPWSLSRRTHSPRIMLGTQEPRVPRRSVPGAVLVGLGVRGGGVGGGAEAGLGGAGAEPAAGEGGRRGDPGTRGWFHKGASWRLLVTSSFLFCLMSLDLLDLRSPSCQDWKQDI